MKSFILLSTADPYITEVDKFMQSRSNRSLFSILPITSLHMGAAFVGNHFCSPMWYSLPIPLNEFVVKQDRIQ